ncbi:VC0807 family protein [Amycolatopsis sp. NPDC051903]|uniref:VC0807 family protein n=1 Tax=Amycolatopsis sp. NPDC051903 TaxID=3363936 RepID=UPI0037B60FCB
MTLPTTARASRIARLKALFPALLCDVLLPGVRYFTLHAAGAGDLVALSAALLIGQLLRLRRMQILSAVMLGVFVLGATLLTGDVRLLVLKDSFVTGAVALVFVGTTRAGRPLLYLLGRKFETADDPAKVAAFDERCATHAPTRRHFRVLSWAWGLGLLLEAAVLAVLCFVLPIETIAALSPVLLFGTLTVIYFLAKRYLATRRA